MPLAAHGCCLAVMHGCCLAVKRVGNAFVIHSICFILKMIETNWGNRSGVRVRYAGCVVKTGSCVGCGQLCMRLVVGSTML